MFKFFYRGLNYLFGGQMIRKGVFSGATLEYLERDRRIQPNYFDYVRLATLELISFEINRKGLLGNVAELGVYKGKFARFINEYFKDRSLYLFDTFEGFDQRDVKTETTKNFSGGNQDFSDTSVEAVLSLMPYPTKCKIVKGFFPESAAGINDKFVFVSLDADLYEPIYQGLRFFYPKLVKGGYIFIHDFNNDLYKGSRKAVEQFCEENEINFLPIPDSGGSAIVMK